MRIGIYLGRHSGNAGALGVFARSLAVQLIAASSREEAGALELVIYGDAVLLNSQFLERLSLLPQLIEPLDTIFTRGADAFMRVLPNGARISVVIRRLPSIPRTSFAQLFDQALIPLLAKRDKIDLLHSVADIGVSSIAISTIFASTSRLFNYFQAGRLPQIITVHDLGIILPSEPENSRPSPTASLRKAKFESPVPSRAGASQLEKRNRDVKRDFRWFGITAKLMLLQYRSSAGSVFVATRASVVDQLIFKLGLSRESVYLIRPGVDEYFTRYSGIQIRGAELNREIEREINRLFGLRCEYVLHFYSTDQGKKSIEAIRGWKKFAQSQPEHLVLVNAPEVIKVDGSEEIRLKDYFSEHDLESRVHLLPWVDRENLPLLLAGSAVLLAPSGGQDWEMAQLEALTVGTPVVTGDSADWDQAHPTWGRMVFKCEANDDDSIANALELALSIKDRRTSIAGLRTMEKVAQDYLNMYRDVHLKFGKRRAPA